MKIGYDQPLYVLPIGDLFKDDVDVLWPLMDQMRAEKFEEVKG